MPTYDPASVTLTIGGVRMEGIASIAYRDAPPGSVAGVDGRVKGRVVTRSTTSSSFGRSAVRALVASAAADLGLDATVKVSEPYPPDGRVLVTVGDSRGPLRSRDLAAIRAALAPFLPAGVVAVVRDAAQLRGMRERALAEQGDVAPAVTVAELRSRMRLREGWRR